MKMIAHIIATLNSEVGFSWPVLLVTSFLKRNNVFKRTRWASDYVSKQEAANVKRLAIASALYLTLGAK